MQNDLTPVLNVDKNMIVMLPVANAIIMRQSAIFQVGEVTDFELLAIHDHKYQELQSAMGGLREPNEVDTKNFVVDSIYKHQDKDGNVLSVPAIAHIYDHFEDDGYGRTGKDGKPTQPILCVYERFTTIGCGVVERLKEIPETLSDWHEATADELVALYKLDVADMTEEDKYEAVIHALECETDTCYQTSYTIDEKDLFLYQKI